MIVEFYFFVGKFNNFFNKLNFFAQKKCFLGQNNDEKGLNSKKIKEFVVFKLQLSIKIINFAAQANSITYNKKTTIHENTQDRTIYN